MYDFHPYYTADGSVGLYSPEYNDIYHSATGALTEAYDKFIELINFEKLFQKNSIKVLDICFGIGYNSKSFFQKIYSLTEYNIDTIHTNNINNKITNTLSTCNDKIYSNNIFNRISVTAVDNDKILAFLSPFIKTGEKNIKNKKFDFEYKNLEKYLKNDNNIPKPKIKNFINFLIFDKIVQKHPEILENSDIEYILSSKKYSRYFDRDLKGIYRLYQFKAGKLSSNNPVLTFLHNIYYNHVSNCYKKDLKRYNLQDLSFSLQVGDARDIIKNDNNLYDLIFLDAFTPSKCPNLWSYEFFKLLYKHLNEDGMILTYSTSASIRSAMVEAGFYIGDNFNSSKNKNFGTIAVKNSDLIKYQLSEFDLGLLKTKAGIFYRDENLTGQNKAIIERRISEVKNSNKISTSSYKRNMENNS